VFSKIAATGSKPEVFNGTCGQKAQRACIRCLALDSRFGNRVQKKAKSQEKPPILPRRQNLFKLRTG